MTLRADLLALLADAGITEADVDQAVMDEHVRSALYQRITSVVAASADREGDLAVVAVILRDPEALTAKTAVVNLVDEFAARASDPAAFERWATALLTETETLKAADRRFIHRRIHDWLFYLSVQAGDEPSLVELAEVTNWMQRLLAEYAMPLPVLRLLAESGSSK